MKSIPTALGMSLVLALSGQVHAQASYQAEFTVTQLPQLRTEGVADPAGTVGRWSPGWENSPGAYVATEGMPSEPAAGASNWWSSWTTGMASGPVDHGPPLYSSLVDVKLDTPVGVPTGEAWFGPDGLGVATTFANGYGRTNINSTWWRRFELDAHSSVTLSGIWNISASGSAAVPVNLTPSFETGSSHYDADAFSILYDDVHATLRIGNLNQGLAGVMGGKLLTTPELAANAFSYTWDEAGRASFTIANPTDQVHEGEFYLGAYARVATAVPEPTMAVTLLPGLVVVAAMARRRRARGGLWPAAQQASISA